MSITSATPTTARQPRDLGRAVRAARAAGPGGHPTTTAWAAPVTTDPPPPGASPPPAERSRSRRAARGPAGGRPLAVVDGHGPRRPLRPARHGQRRVGVRHGRLPPRAGPGRGHAPRPHTARRAARPAGRRRRRLARRRRAGAGHGPPGGGHAGPARRRSPGTRPWRPARTFAGHHEHPFPGCFVCGTDRGDGDGLRLFAGPVAGLPGTVAAAYTPHPAHTHDGRRLPPAAVWACSTARAPGSPTAPGRSRCSGS